MFLALKVADAGAAECHVDGAMDPVACRTEQRDHLFWARECEGA